MDSGVTRTPSVDDQALLGEARVPATLNLSPINYPSMVSLNRIIDIVRKYQWESSQVVVTTDYDEVAADLANLQSSLVLYSDIDGLVSLAHKNMRSNRDTISSYHFQRLRKREDAHYQEQLFLYKQKKIPKPERTTDSAIKAEVDVLLAMLKYPEEMNKLESLNIQVDKFMKRAEGMTIVLQALLRRAERRGQ